MMLRHPIWLVLVTVALAAGQSPATALAQQSTPGIPSDEELARELKPVPPRTPDEELAAMQFDDELIVELVAAEPHVVDPVDVAFDSAGNMYVVEMRDYPFEAERPEDMGRLRLLRDTDGDGYYETSTVFASGLHWPTSVHPWRDGVLVVAAPDVVFLADRDGDGRADVRQLVLTGFGTQNVQALANGLAWSVDCRLYLANGGNGGDIRTGELFGKLRQLRLGRSDLRLFPPSVLETVTGGGQFGHSMDDFGRRFICNNSDHARFVVLEERFLARNPYLRVTRTVDSIAEEGPSAVVYRISPPEPWRVIRTRLRVAGLVPGPVEHGGKAAGYFTSATGITVYRGDALPQGYGGCLFVGDVAGNLVHRKTLTPFGASFRARRAEQNREFLACADLWFRPVNFANGPDGALYICDMYREVVEHPASIPDFMKRHLNLKSGSDRGRIWRVRARRSVRPQAELLYGRTEADLVLALESRRGWVRDTAQRLLMEKEHLSPETLERLKRLARNSTNPAARAAAIWILFRVGEPCGDLLLASSRDNAPEVREQAARIALEAPAREEARQVILRGARDDAPRVRLFAAYGLGELGDEPAVGELAHLCLDARNDTWILTAALSSCSPTRLLPDGRSLCYAVLNRILDGKPVDQTRAKSTVSRLAEMLVLARRDREFAAAFQTAVQQSEDLATVIALAGAGAATRRRSTLTAILDAVDPAAAHTWNRLLQKAADHVRRGAPDATDVTLLAYAPEHLFANLVEQILTPRTPVALQSRFIQQCGAVRRDRWYELALGQWPQLTPAVRATLAEALLSRDESSLAFLDAIRRGNVQPADVAADVAARLREHRNPKIRELARQLLGTVSTAAADRQQLIERYIREGALGEGDPAKGKELFAEHCAKCHGEPGEGGSIGPDLNTIRARDARQILLAILAPNLEVAPQYLSYTIALDDGRVLTGTIVEETATALTIGKSDGTKETVLRSSIDAIRSSGQSLMPTGLEQQLGPQEIADIIAYIRSSENKAASAPKAP